MKKFFAMALAALMVAGTFVGCGGGGASSTSATESSQVESEGEPTTGQMGGEITVDNRQEPPDLFSVTTTTTGSGNVLRHVMDGLVGLDENDNPVPRLATSWDVSADGRGYTFHLVEGATWSNGEKVTAHDFVFAWSLLFDQEIAAEYAQTWAPMFVGAMEKFEGKELSAEAKKELENAGFTGGIGVKATDDYTLDVLLTAPYPYFVGLTAYMSFYPLNEKGYNDIGGAGKYGIEADALVTNGPFLMTSWTHEDRIVLEKNPNYYAADQTKLDKITITSIADSSTRLNAYRTGDLDYAIMPGDQRAIAESEGIPIYNFDDASTWFFEFGTTRPGLKNAKVRRALTLGVDTQQFVTNIVKNDSTVANSFVPPGLVGGAFTVESGDMLNRPAAGDYSAAKALLEEGLKEEGLTVDTFKVSMITDDTDNAQKYGAFFQEQWKTNLGLEVGIDVMTYKNRIARMQAKDIEIVMSAWGPDYNDPMTFLDMFISTGGNNHTSWASAEYDQLVADAMAESDTAKRNEMMHTLEKTLMDELPIGPIYHRVQDYIKNEKLEGEICTAFQEINFRTAYLK